MKTRMALAALAALLLLDVGVALSGASLWCLPALLLGWFLADLASGAIHMFMDYRPSRPGVGLDRLYFYEGSRESADYVALRQAVFARLGPVERITYDFKNHHPRPDALGRRSMVTQIGSTALFVSLPFCVVANVALFALHGPPVAAALLVAFVAGATFAQYFHGTLHRADNPWPIGLLRHLRLLMRPEHHLRHHETLQRDFSTISGWSNPLLNLVFRHLRQRGLLHEDGLTPR